MAKDATVEAFINRERARLEKAHKDAIAKKAEIDSQLKSIERELAAISAYQRAKGEKPRRPRKAAAARRPRARRGEKRQAVLQLVKQHPEGLSRGEILTIMGVKGNKSGEQSVSNALTALKKSSRLGSRDGKYVAL